MIEFHAPEHVRNVVRIITETGLRVYKELMSMRKDQIDLDNFRTNSELRIRGSICFPSDKNESGHQTTLKPFWHKTLKRAKIPYFRIYDLRSTYATRLSAGGVADEWATHLLRQGDAKIFKKYSQMKLPMKREALEKSSGKRKR